jgi:hypothetical protein
MLSIYLQDEEKYVDAIEVLQMGVAAGYENAAGRLEEAFRNPPPSNELYYLGQQEDLERAARYEKIWRVLANYSYAHPKVPEINDILPLPPAKLPAWNGKLQWLEERLANVPPEKPSAVLIKQLANAMVLDPATGRPMPGSSSFSENNFIGPTCFSGEACPQSGYWKIMWAGGHEFYQLVGRNVPRHFSQGELMPMGLVGFYQQRIWPLPEKYRQGHIGINWGLLG